jgi:hypothetical protein
MRKWLGMSHIRETWDTVTKFSTESLAESRYLSTAQINPYRPTPGHSATESLLDVVYIFSRSALSGGRGQFFFPHQRSKSAIGIKTGDHSTK